MNIVNLIEMLEKIANRDTQKNDINDVHNQTERQDFDEFKETIELHLNFYENIMDQKIQCQKNLKILKKIVLDKSKNSNAKVIKKLPLSDKRILFNLLSKRDENFTLENFNKQFETMNKNSIGSSNNLSQKELSTAAKFFIKLDVAIAYLIFNQEGKHDEYINTLNKTFKDIYKIKKFYNKMEPIGNTFINEALEKILCEEIPLSEKGIDLFKRTIKSNNEIYQQNLLEKRKEEERLKEQRRIERLQQQKEALIKAQTQSKPQEEIEVLELDEDYIAADVIDPEFERNVEIYTKLILDCYDLDILETNFPPKNIKKYHKLLTHIITNVRDVVEKNSLELDKTEDIDVRKYIQEEIELETEKLNRLLTYYQTKEVEKEEETDENTVHLIFATKNGKVLLLDDFKDHKYLDHQNCIDTLTLLYKLQSEDFGNSNELGRKIQNNNTLNDIFELKTYQSRLYFKRLPGHCYYVMMAMIKKDDNTMFYRKQLENRANSTLTEYNNIKRAIENNELPKSYFEEHERIIEVSNNMLLPKESRKI